MMTLSNRMLITVGLLMVTLGMAVGTWHLLSPRSSPINYLLTGDVLPAVARPQRPPTLDPMDVRAAARGAYRVARERPALLEGVACYCGCYLSAGHQNSLDCFRDRHAESCEVCIQIALRAEELEKRGYGGADIKALIDREFAPKKRNPQ